jgi:hypothetical protein
VATEIIFQDGKWVGVANGQRIVKSYDQTRVVKMMAKAGYKSVPIRGDDVRAEVRGVAGDAVDPEQSAWNINQRFQFVTDLVTMVARGRAVSLIVTGPGGLGKTHTVVAGLTAAGLKDVSGRETESPERSFKQIKGYSTAKGLYRELFMNKDSVIVFDDCDSVLRDPVALNLLKGALDSYDRRIISWNADLRDEDLPRSFIFNGRVVFISNMRRSQLDLALKTRAYVVDLAMTRAQKLERMGVLAESDEFMPEMDRGHLRDSLQLIESVGDRAQEISLRSLQAVARIRAGGGRDWRNLAEYVLTQ